MLNFRLSIIEDVTVQPSLVSIHPLTSVGNQPARGTERLLEDVIGIAKQCWQSVFQTVWCTR